MAIILAGSDYLTTSYDQADLIAGRIEGKITPSAFDFGQAIGVIEFEGKPFGFGNCDTIRKRNENAYLPVNGAKTTIEIEWTLVSIGSKKPVELQGDMYDVKVMLTPGLRSLGKMDMTRDDNKDIIGGTFFSSVLVRFTALFVNKNDSAKTFAVNSQVLMDTKKTGYWSTKPHKEKFYKVDSASNPPEISNFTENLLPDMYNFFQTGALFEGAINRGGMTANSA
jgi:hypothetical protein